MLALARFGLACVEPFYAAVTSLRNLAFTVGLLPTHEAPRATISVGNITTGGTGKTPVVQWLAHRLTVGGHRVCILLRGYHGGDEQRMLQTSLGDDVRVEANSSRVAGAAAAIAADPDISCFVLDDGFQHRRISRDLDLVLIDASNPFGFDHVLPRGLLREPIRGLKRAEAFLITHCESASDAELERLRATLRRYRDVPIFHAEHVTALPTHLVDRPIFGFCGIGNPEAFRRQLGEKLAGFAALPDHHLYTADDLRALNQQAKASGAAVLVTTEKDWVKVSAIARADDALPIEPLGLSLRFRGDEERRLLTLVLERVTAKMVAIADER